jgi:hypothetical protein
LWLTTILGIAPSSLSLPGSCAGSPNPPDAAASPAGCRTPVPGTHAQAVVRFYAPDASAPTGGRSSFVFIQSSFAPPGDAATPITGSFPPRNGPCPPGVSLCRPPRGLPPATDRGGPPWADVPTAPLPCQQRPTQFSPPCPHKLLCTAHGLGYLFSPTFQGYLWYCSVNAPLSVDLGEGWISCAQSHRNVLRHTFWASVHSRL